MLNFAYGLLLQLHISTTVTDVQVIACCHVNEAPTNILQSCDILPCQSTGHQESNGGRVISGGKQNALG